MWFSLNLRIILTTSFFVSASIAYSSQNIHQDYELLNLEQHSQSHRESRNYKETLWAALVEENKNYPYGKETKERKVAGQGNIMNLNSRPESDSVTLTPQKFGDTAESMRRGEEILLDEVFRSKRESYSLSIRNPLDVLQQRQMLVMAHRQMQDYQNQIRENEVLLQNLGKRSISTNTNAEKKIEVKGTKKHDYLRRIHV